MLRSYKYRLYPNKAQKVLIDKHIGSCRFIYNLALEVKNYAYMNQRKSLSCIDLMNQIPDLKNELPWLKEVDSQSLQQAVINLDKAFTAFFKHGAAFPKFKKKVGSNQSFRNPHGKRVSITGNKIILPKFTEGIEFVQDRTFKGEIRSNTVSRTPTGKYYVSILVDTKIDLPEKKPILTETTIGIDLGLKNFIITSAGEKYDNPRHLKNGLARLKVIQRRVGRTKKGSANRKKAVRRLAVLHEKIANRRKDFIHKTTTNLVKNHDTICMEDLAVSNMVKNHCLAQAIGDVGWGMFETFVKYKAEWAGKNVLQIPTFEPSTKVCSCCGAINKTLTLANREWICASCGAHHDRDINAAIVIKKYCLTKYSPEGIGSEPAELPTLVGALKQENVVH